MKENGQETQQPRITHERTTKEISPQEIADALGGMLEESADIMPKWNVHLYYGEPKPVLTLKCDVEGRSIFLGVNAISDTTNKLYRSVTALYDIEELRFIEYTADVPGGIQTDMVVSVRNSSSSLIVSKYVHEPRF